MAKQCSTEKTARRQEWIENGLLELMHERRFEQITVTDLCIRLNLSRRSFYRYFRDLEDVLDSAMDHFFQSMAIPDYLPGVEDIRRNFEFWQEHRWVLDALNHSGMTDKLFEYIARYTKPETLRLPALADPRDIQLCREIGQFATAGAVALIIGWYQEGFQRSPEEMAQISCRMLYEPLLKK